MDLARATLLTQQGRLRELLGVPANARGAELRKALRAARCRYHPDKGGDPRVASVINAAADKLKDSEGLSNSASSTPAAWQSAPTSSTPAAWQSAPTFSDTAAKLLREIKILEDACQSAGKLVEESGCGWNLTKFCSEGGACECSGCIARRLQSEGERLQVLIDWAVEFPPRWPVRSPAESLLKDRLQQAIARALSHRQTCQARAKMFEALQQRQEEDDARAWRREAGEISEAEDSDDDSDEQSAHENVTEQDANTADPEPEATTNEGVPSPAGATGLPMPAEPQVERDLGQEVEAPSDARANAMGNECSAGQKTRPAANEQLWRCCLEECSRADSDTSHHILKHIARGFGQTAASQARIVYTSKVLHWYGGTKRVLTDNAGRYVRVKRAAATNA